MTHIVSSISCESYYNVNTALPKMLSRLGGLERYVRPGMRVLVKPNAVIASPGEKAACTHPSVAAAVCRMVRELGATAVLAESPGGPFTKAWVNKALTQSGIWPACAEEGAELNDDFGVEEVSFPQGALLRRMTLIHALQGCDALINVCKLKTHGMLLFSGAAKNTFGCVPGALKNEAHVRFQKTPLFAAQLNDICLRVAPALHIMDAVIGMEGDGPTSGTPRHLGALFASDNPWALDDIACRHIRIDPKRVPQLKDAAERGLYTPDDIRVLGDLPHSVEFLLPVQHEDARFGNPFVHFILKNALRTLPVPKSGCKGCGICAERCPPGAITMRDGRPFINKRACIRCYCCQELCPYGMMDIHRTLVARAIQRRRERV